MAFWLEWHFPVFYSRPPSPILFLSCWCRQLPSFRSKTRHPASENCCKKYLAPVFSWDCSAVCFSCSSDSWSVNFCLPVICRQFYHHTGVDLSFSVCKWFSAECPERIWQNNNLFYDQHGRACHPHRKCVFRNSRFRYPGIFMGLIDQPACSQHLLQCCLKTSHLCLKGFQKCADQTGFTYSSNTIPTKRRPPETRLFCIFHCIRGSSTHTTPRSDTLEYNIKTGGAFLQCTGCSLLLPSRELP